MQIDRFNLHQNYNKIQEHLKGASFVSFDCQFSGLVTNLEKIQGKFPDHKQFYERIKQTALNFKILQLGLTCFIFNQEKKSYQAFSYNFYILPFVNQPDFNNVMISEVASLAFLSEHGIDWNRIFKSGIIPNRLMKPFEYSPHKYDKRSNKNQNQYFFNQQDKLTIDKIQETLENISQKKIQKIIDFEKEPVYNLFVQKYLGKLVLKKVKKTKKVFQFYTSIIGGLQDDQEDDDVIQKVNQPKLELFNSGLQSKTIEQKNSKELVSQNLNNLTKEISIQSLLQIIVQLQIPIVGHFPNLDIGLIYHTYFQSLPGKFEDFCHKISGLFPSIYDTKTLSRRVAHDFKGLKVNLKSLYEACKNPKIFQAYCNIIQCEQSQLNQNRHEAGYDSYLTGFAFVGMANYLLKNNTGHPVNFKLLQDLNNLIYSRDSGQILLRQPFCQKSIEFQRKIVVWKENKKNKLWKQIARNLSTYGTLYVTQDHGQTYFVFEQQNQKIQLIINQFSQVYDLMHYNQRNIPKARDIYTRSQEQLYYINEY